MKVTLVTHTPFPLDVLLFTKSTRLDMTPGLFDTIAKMPMADKEREIAYMAKTIRSSWEFVDIIFLVEGITRPTAQQMTRTRNASFAMQSQRVADVSKMAVSCPFDEGTENYRKFMHSARVAGSAYKEITESGGDKQDARGILPQNVTCNLVAKYNLRNFVDLCAARESLRVQSKTGEYGDVVQQMKALVLAVMPWAAPFFVPRHAMAVQTLEALAKSMGVTPGEGPGWEIAKVVDMLRAAE